MTLLLILTVLSLAVTGAALYVTVRHDRGAPPRSHEPDPFEPLHARARFDVRL